MKNKEITITNKLEELEKIRLELELIGEQWHLTPGVVFSVNLALEELITNIVFYGFNDNEEHQIDIGFILDSKFLTIKIEDEGKAFNPFEIKEPSDLNKPLKDRQIGGLGIHLVKKTMDHVEYTRKGKKNIVTIKIKINQ